MPHDSANVNSFQVNGKMLLP